MSRDYSGTPSYKILIVGSLAVGKTSLLKRWTNKLFLADYEPTLGVNINNIDSSGKDKKLIFKFWDIPGQEFIFNKSTLDEYCRETAAVCLMWDCGRDETYQDLSKFLDFIKNKFSRETPIIFVAGKVDLFFNPEKINALSKQKSEIKKKALEIGFKTVGFVCTSAKEAIGFVELELALVRMVHKPKKEETFEKQDGHNEYKPSLFQHTRQIRNRFISEIIKIAENLPDENFAIERVWLDMNLHSIKDTGSKTAGLIKKFLNNNPKKTSKNTLNSNLIDKNFAKKFHQAQSLLDLISEKETQIFGFKFVFSFFEETRKARRDKQHQEIEKLYNQARALFESIVSAEGVESLHMTLSTRPKKHM